jgi:hypothetical protein
VRCVRKILILLLIVITAFDVMKLEEVGHILTCYDKDITIRRQAERILRSSVCDMIPVGQEV